ncbi:glycosyltransferase family 2 protein [Actinoplanes sp. NPDC049265]|uniref:glycosyltransferase family 2 protein n=1 Tax=Actinoplanes sp. NPDC049265 TaxID=3363902 RepID=UPI0037245507
MDISVVIPCYRSAETLPPLVERLAAITTDGRKEILLVVDGGDRATWAAASRLDRRHDEVRAMRLSRNYGQHNALVAGIREARHEVVVTMDDDLQHRPEEIGTLLAALTPDVDLVYGVAAEEEHGAARSLASRLAKSGLERLLRVPGARQLSAFRAFRTFLRDGFTELRGPHACLDVALSWGTTSVTSVTVRMDEREHGRSGYTLRMLLRHTLNMVLGYSAAPLRLVTYLGFLVGLIGVLLLGRVLWLYFTGETTVAGFTTVASMVALFSAAQMIAVGVLGEYIGRIHANGLGLPTYVVRPAEPDPEAPQGKQVTAAVVGQRVDA